MVEFMIAALLMVAGCYAEPEIFTSPRGIQVTRMPAADGNLHVYALPVGQGDAQVIQCPNGDLSIYDWGSSSDQPSRFWNAAELLFFLEGHLNRVLTFIITHNHWDHYSFVTETFDGGPGRTLNNLRDIYISCQRTHFPGRLNTWMSQNPRFEGLIRPFNNGGQCGPRGGLCGTINICPGTSVVAEVLAANLGQNCVDGNRNMDSMLTKISWGSRSILLGGDLNDETTSWNEDGPMRWIVDFWGPMLESTVYQIAHHSSESLANKPFFRDATRPLAAYSSGDPWVPQLMHPRCSVFNGLINFTGTLCQPLAGPGSPNHCGLHVFPGTPDERLLQSVYTCGPGQVHTTNNPWALYTTTPDASRINMVTYSTNGNAWGVTAMMFNSALVDHEEGACHLETDEMP